MKQLLLIFLLLFTLTACQDKEAAQKEQAARDARIIKQVRLELEREFAHKEAKLQQALAEKEALLSQQEKTLHDISKSTSQEETDKLNNMGINVQEGVISIDTNKTRDFFKTLGDTMNQKIEEVNNDMQKGIVDIKNAGIQINNEHINIDLNKTKEMLDMWSKKMQTFVKEVDSLSRDIDNNITTKGN